jgi:hypothetical protein
MSAGAMKKPRDLVTDYLLHRLALPFAGTGLPHGFASVLVELAGARRFFVAFRALQTTARVTM